MRPWRLYMSLRHLPENIRIAAVKTPLSPRHNSRRMYHSVIKLRARLRFPSGSVRDGLLGLALGSYSGFSERGLQWQRPPVGLLSQAKETILRARRTGRYGR